MNKSGGQQDKADVKPNPKFDFGTPELRKRFLFALENANAKGDKHVRIYSHPLDFYYKKRSDGKSLINQRQKDAGDRLYNDYEKGSFVRYGVASYARERIDGGRSGDGLNEVQESARERFSKALRALGDDLSIWIAFKVCCDDTYMKNLDIPYYETSNQAMARLREVLDRLADHYGMPRYFTPVERAAQAGNEQAKPLS